MMFEIDIESGKAGDVFSTRYLVIAIRLLNSKKLKCAYLYILIM